jgi:hypothetical protein
VIKQLHIPSVEPSPLQRAAPMKNATASGHPEGGGVVAGSLHRWHRYAVEEN